MSGWQVPIDDVMNTVALDGLNGRHFKDVCTLNSTASPEDIIATLSDHEDVQFVVQTRTAQPMVPVYDPVAGNIGMLPADAHRKVLNAEELKTVLQGSNVMDGSLAAELVSQLNLAPLPLQNHRIPEPTRTDSALFDRLKALCTTGGYVVHKSNIGTQVGCGRPEPKPPAAEYELRVVMSQAFRNQVLTGARELPSAMKLQPSSLAALEIVGQSGSTGITLDDFIASWYGDKGSCLEILEHLKELSLVTPLALRVTGKARTATLQTVTAYVLSCFDTVPGSRLLTLEQIADRLGQCDNKSAFSRDLRKVMGQHGSVKAWTNMIQTLKSEEVVREFSQQFVEDKKKKTGTCLELISPYPVVEPMMALNVSPIRLIKDLIRERGAEGVSFRDDVQRRFGLSRTLGELCCNHLLNTKKFKASKLPFTQNTRFYTIEAAPPDAVNESSADVGNSGRVKDLRGQSRRRVRLLKKIVQERKVVVLDMDFRREFREIEATDFQNDAVKAMDSKTLLRLINRLQNGVQNVKGEEDEPPYGRWMTRTINLQNGRQNDVNFYIDPSADDAAIEAVVAITEQGLNKSRKICVNLAKSDKPVTRIGDGLPDPSYGVGVSLQENRVTADDLAKHGYIPAKWLRVREFHRFLWSTILGHGAQRPALLDEEGNPRPLTEFSLKTTLFSLPVSVHLKIIGYGGSTPKIDEIIAQHNNSTLAELPDEAKSVLTTKMKPLPRLRTLFKQLEQLELVTSPETNEYILADTVTLHDTSQLDGTPHVFKFDAECSIDEFWSELQRIALTSQRQFKNVAGLKSASTLSMPAHWGTVKQEKPSKAVKREAAQVKRARKKARKVQDSGAGSAGPGTPEIATAMDTGASPAVVLSEAHRRRLQEVRQHSSLPLDFVVAEVSEEVGLTAEQVLAAVDLEEAEPATPGQRIKFSPEEDVLFKRCFIAARIMGEDAPDNVDDNIAELINAAPITGRRGPRTAKQCHRRIRYLEKNVWKDVQVTYWIETANKIPGVAEASTLAEKVALIPDNPDEAVPYEDVKWEIPDSLEAFNDQFDIVLGDEERQFDLHEQALSQFILFVLFLDKNQVGALIPSLTRLPEQSKIENLFEHLRSSGVAAMKKGPKRTPWDTFALAHLKRNYLKPQWASTLLWQLNAFEDHLSSSEVVDFPKMAEEGVLPSFFENLATGAVEVQRLVLSTTPSKGAAASSLSTQDILEPSLAEHGTKNFAAEHLVTVRMKATAEFKKEHQKRGKRKRDAVQLPPVLEFPDPDDVFTKCKLNKNRLACARATYEFILAGGTNGVSYADLCDEFADIGALQTAGSFLLETQLICKGGQSEPLRLLANTPMMAWTTRRLFGEDLAVEPERLGVLGSFEGICCDQWQRILREFVAEKVITRGGITEAKLADLISPISLIDLQIILQELQEHRVITCHKPARQLTLPLRAVGPSRLRIEDTSDRFYMSTPQAYHSLAAMMTSYPQPPVEDEDEEDDQF